MSFLILPAVVFGLSMAGRIPFIVVGSIFVVTVAFIVVLNILQRKKPNWLPEMLRKINMEKIYDLIKS
jgi:sodium-dependent phosphate cotransporter